MIKPTDAQLEALGGSIRYSFFAYILG